MFKKWAVVVAAMLGAVGATSAGAASTTTMCAFSHLKITRSSVLAASGHRSIVLVFTNSGAACTLHGYPGADALSGKLKRVASAKRTLAGYMGGFTHGKKPPVVHLSKGQTASAVLEWSGIGGSPTCVRARYFLVTPPGATRSKRFAPPHLNAEVICHLQIHPVVRGPSGQG